MATDNLKDRDQPEAAKQPGEHGTAASAGTGATSSSSAAGAHQAATAHGRPATVDTSLPATRPELMELHRTARARRNGAPLGSESFRAAVDEIARIEVRIAAIDRAADPPLG
ncbi:MAG TPA: hypothetical protein VM427_05355 [Patescibacteria group bacterium]|nr:hypothetical protein [Patescibacteria group bacterium]